MEEESVDKGDSLNEMNNWRDFDLPGFYVG
jgi:hypothetical protein